MKSVREPDQDCFLCHGTGKKWGATARPSYELVTWGSGLVKCPCTFLSDKKYEEWRETTKQRRERHIEANGGLPLSSIQPFYGVDY